jgi:hypothetical protein
MTNLSPFQLNYKSSFQQESQLQNENFELKQKIMKLQLVVDEQHTEIINHKGHAQNMMNYIEEMKEENDQLGQQKKDDLDYIEDLE